MNKKRVGIFLKKLRNDKKWSQDKLSEKFQNNNFEVNVKTISDWENGKTIPDPDKLKFLSNLYDITIDELLDGERYKEIDFYKEYPFADNYAYAKYSITDDVYKIHQEQKIKTIRRFKELLSKKIEKDLTRKEEEEFKFLFDHFCSLSKYGKEYVKNETSEYLSFLEAFRRKLLEIGGVTFKEKLFEISKLLITKGELGFDPSELIDDRKPNRYVDIRFKLLNWWEKDMFLMSIQQGEIERKDPSLYGADYLKIYETEHKKDFDKNEYARNVIRYMIENGACLNYQFINVIRRTREKHRIIDETEKLYLECKKPLKLIYQEYNKNITSYIENNPKNRFIVNYYYNIKSNLYFLNLGLDELYDFVWKYDPNSLPEDLLLLFAKNLKIDTTKGLKYVKADFKQFESYLDYWNQYRQKEVDIKEGLIELKRLEEELNNGKKYDFVCKEDSGGKITIL